jgi:hypothetical protein
LFAFWVDALSTFTIGACTIALAVHGFAFGWLAWYFENGCSSGRVRVGCVDAQIVADEPRSGPACLKRESVPTAEVSRTCVVHVP